MLLNINIINNRKREFYCVKYEFIIIKEKNMNVNVKLIDKILIKCLLLDGNETSLLEYNDLIKFKIG